MWVYDICYDMFKIFSTFPPLSLYSDRWCFSGKFLNMNLIFNTFPCFSDQFIWGMSSPIILLCCLSFVFVNRYIHLMNMSYALEVCITHQINNMLELHILSSNYSSCRVRYATRSSNYFWSPSFKNMTFYHDYIPHEYILILGPEDI